MCDLPDLKEDLRVVFLHRPVRHQGQRYFQVQVQLGDQVQLRWGSQGGGSQEQNDGRDPRQRRRLLLAGERLAL